MRSWTRTANTIALWTILLCFLATTHLFVYMAGADRERTKWAQYIDKMFAIDCAGREAKP
jgi:hypothetical protein